MVAVYCYCFVQLRVVGFWNPRFLIMILDGIVPCSFVPLAPHRLSEGARAPSICLATNEKFVAETASGLQYPLQESGLWLTVKTLFFWSSPNFRDKIGFSARADL